jgi:hypothetical protein
MLAKRLFYHFNDATYFALVILLRRPVSDNNPVCASHIAMITDIAPENSFNHHKDTIIHPSFFLLDLISYIILKN